MSTTENDEVIDFRELGHADRAFPITADRLGNKLALFCVVGVPLKIPPTKI